MIREGDRCTYVGHTHGNVARVMAVAEGYALMRYPRCGPFVAPVRDLRLVDDEAG